MTNAVHQYNCDLCKRVGEIDPIACRQHKLASINIIAKNFDRCNFFLLPFIRTESSKVTSSIYSKLPPFRVFFVVAVVVLLLLLLLLLLFFSFLSLSYVTFSSFDMAHYLTERKRCKQKKKCNLCFKLISILQISGRR